MADPSRLGLYFLDVGPGDCTFVVPPEGEGGPVLIDCADGRVAERFVANHGLTSLAAVVASRLDRGHIGAMLGFLRSHFEAGRRVERLILGLDRKPLESADAELRALLSQAAAWEKSPPHEGFRLEPPFPTAAGPVEVARGKDWDVGLVLPLYGAVVGGLFRRDPDDCSAVIRVARGGTAILVGGDATLASWERIEPELLPAAALRAPRHGGEIRGGGEVWSRFADLHDRVGAETTVVSVGTAAAEDAPLPEHLAAARRGGACRVLCTQMTRRCHPDPAALRERALALSSGVEWPYRHHGGPGASPAETPCAGSVVLWIDEAGAVSVEPSRSGPHRELLGLLTHPLCGDVE